MNAWLLFLVLVLAFACLVAAFFRPSSNRRSRVRPPPRSRRVALSYEETNSVAKLFSEALSLKESSATWPRILKVLNAEDDPHTRTLLLEIRTLNSADPRVVLEAIEQVCIQSKPEGDRLSRIELLERVKATMRKVAV